MTPLRRTLAALLAVVVVALVAPVGARSAPTWAPADEATIHPGVQTYTEGAQCTANFVFTNGTDTFLGQAAHCSGTGGNTETNGCEAGTLPLGTPVEIDGASRPGTLVYNSWIAMQQSGETDEDTCLSNDFALIKIDPADVDSVNPSVPAWGGPTALGTSTTEGEDVFSYGNSSLRLGISALSPKTGVALFQSESGRTHTVYTVTPGIPGDSGSGFLNSSGEAIGVLSTLQVLPMAAANDVADLASALDYAQAHGFSADLVPGTEPFSGDLGGLTRG